MKNHEKTVKILRNIARVFLIILAAFWFVFALLSGAEEYGGGIQGIIKNSPNALPWAVLFVCVFITWKWELIGGILLIAMGVFTAIQFDAFESVIILCMISLPLVLMGIIFILSWYNIQGKNQGPAEA